MYAVDQPTIAAWVNVGAPDWLKRAASVYLTVAVTILNSTPGVMGHCNGLKRDGAAAETLNFPTRRAAYMAILAGLYVQPFLDAAACMAAGDEEGAIIALCGLPSLGYAKAGFVLQLIWGVAGCIDTRNAAFFKVTAPDWNPTARDKTKRKHARTYLDLCARLGGSALLWDVWCAGVSAQWPSRFPTADAVSAEHVDWIMAVDAGLWRRAIAPPAAIAPAA